MGKFYNELTDPIEKIISNSLYTRHSVVYQEMVFHVGKRGSGLYVPVAVPTFLDRKTSVAKVDKLAETSEGIILEKKIAMINGIPYTAPEHKRIRIIPDNGFLSGLILEPDMPTDAHIIPYEQTREFMDREKIMKYRVYFPKKLIRGGRESYIRKLKRIEGIVMEDDFQGGVSGILSGEKQEIISFNAFLRLVKKNLGYLWEAEDITENVVK